MTPAERRAWDAYVTLGSVKAAATVLGCSESWVKKHVAVLRRRHGVETNVQLAIVLERKAA